MCSKCVTFLAYVLPLCSTESCVAFGKDGLAELENCKSLKSVISLPMTQAYNGTVNWAVEVPGVGAALTDTVNAAVKIWNSTHELLDISLVPLTRPAGAVLWNGLLYVACLGNDDSLTVSSGLAIVNPFTGTLLSTHAFPGGMHVHNAYAMDWDDKAEIFVAVLGNPWANPPVTGRGLAMFDRDAGVFIESTTSVAMNVRSAKQQADGAVYTLSQEPTTEPSILPRLVKRGNHFVVDAQVHLPERTGVDGGGGGADVVLGQHLDTLFASDRTTSAGKLYYYIFEAGKFQLKSIHKTGKTPRYTTILPNGDVVVCNQGDSTLSVFEGLATHPLEYVTATTIPTVSTVMFFVQRSARQHAKGFPPLLV